MKYFRWVGLMSSLVIVGVLGGLMAPLPSEAATLKIDGVDVTLSTPIACDSGYTSCWVITLALNTPRQIGSNWVVGDVSTTNRARVMINDLGTTGSIDKMKLTGVTFTPVNPAGDKTTTVIISHTFSNGQLAGDYLWGMGMAGQFDPPDLENVVGDQVKLVGTGLFADAQPLGTLDTGTLASPTTNNFNGTINKSKATAVVKPGCNTNSSGKCTPTITYTFTIKVRGKDTVKLTDSVIGAGGTCRAPGAVPDVPNGPPDPLTPGRSCNAVAAQADAEIQSDIRAELRAAKKEGAVVPTTCDDTNTCGTIIILKETTSALGGTEFGFIGTGSGLTDFSITTAGNPGAGSWTFSGLETGVAGGLREITETVPEGWYLGSVACVNALLPDENGDTQWSTGYYNEGPVIVSNLEAGDTLTCTFFNHTSD